MDVETASKSLYRLSQGDVTLELSHCGDWRGQGAVLNTSKSADDYVILLFPGNPGVLPFYRDFVRILFNGLKCEVPIVAVGHAGQSAVDHHNKRQFGLLEQVSFKIAFLEELTKLRSTNRKDRSLKIVLMGHSVGAWMAMKVLRHRPKLPIAYCCFLFPTLCDLKVHSIVQVLQIPPIREMFGTLFGRIPRIIKHSIINAVPMITDEAKMIAPYTHPSSIKNVLRLVRDELDQIRELEPEDIMTLKEHADRSFGLFTHHDEYVPRRIYDFLRKTIRDADMTWLEDKHNVKHAFVLNDTHRIAHLLLHHLGSKTALTASMPGLEPSSGACLNSVLSDFDSNQNTTAFAS